MKKEKKKRYHSSDSNIKGRIRIKKKLDLPIKIGMFLIAVAIILICYLKFSKLVTIAVAMLFIFLGIILFIFSRKGKKRKKLLNILLITVLATGIIVLLGFSAFILYVKKQADPKYKIELLNTTEVSRIYDSTGAEIAKLGSEKREKVTYEELPEVLVDAIIATEDSRFFQHNGLDAPRFLMATIKQFLGQPGAGGASTLSMQVVKNSFTDHYGQLTSGKKGIIRKFEDIYLAVFRLEKEYSKEEIIEFYVNNHFLGENIYGVEEAANAYFGKHVTDLNLSEAAILAGMFKSPNAFRPTVNPKNAAARRKTVLYLMRRAGYITEEEEKIANAIPVESLTTNAGTTNANPYQGFIDMVAEELNNKYGVDPYTTPLLVYTTLNVQRQNAVNAVLNGETTYKWVDDKVQAGVAVVNSDDGAILAIGNGRNIGGRSNSSAKILNYATQIKRQIGSTAKPLFDYGPGIEFNGWSTYQQFVDEPYTYSGGRPIKNADNVYKGQMSLRTALALSRNIPALKAFQQVDNNKIKQFVLSLGITPELCASGYKYDRENDKCVNKQDKTDIQNTIALHEAHAIGAFTGSNPLEMAGAYAAFSNGGYYNEPYSVTKFEYRQTGEIIEHQSNKKQVMSEATAFMISSVLQDVSLFSGNRAYVARKTGTTNFDDKTMDDYNMPWDATRDSWIVGYSTKTTLAVWYGYDDFTKESIANGYVLHNVPSSREKDYIFTTLIDYGAMEANRTPFTQPSSVTRIGIAAGSNPAKLAPPGTSTVYELFKKGTEPTEYDLTNYKMPAPTITSHTVENGKITLNWSAVDPGQFGKADHGRFGYNIYKDNVLLAWTDKTSYTYTAPNIYGTYKIIGTYKSYNDVQTEASVIHIQQEINNEEEKEKEKEEEPITNPPENTNP